MIRSRHQRLLSIEILETRFMLTTLTAVGGLIAPGVYPADFVGPIHSGARRASLDSPMGAPTPPIFWVSGTGLSTIGSSVGAGATAGSYKLDSVTYSVGGGELASQLWSSHAASYQRTSGTTHTFAPPASADSWGFLWDETTSAKSVAISAQDSNGDDWSATFGPFNVAHPEASNFQVSIGNAAIGSVSDANGYQFGLFVANNGQPGVTYTASIQNGNGGAIAGFVQLVNADVQSTGDKVVNGAVTETFLQTFTTNGQYALDAPPSQILFGANGGYTLSLVPDEFAQLGGQSNTPYGAPQPNDAPGQALDITSQGAFATDVSIQDSFKTYVNYSEGANIEIAECDWSIDLSATYNLTITGLPSLSDYQNPDNWTVTQNITSGTSSYSPQLITWSSNIGDYSSNTVTEPA